MSEHAELDGEDHAEQAEDTQDDSHGVEQLRRHAVNTGGDGALISVVVSGCRYSCCGRPFARRDFEATYHGWIDHLTDDGFALYAVGIGTVSYVIEARLDELVEVLEPGEG